MPTIRLKNELMRPICTASLSGTVEKEVIALNASLKSFGTLYLLFPFMRGLWLTSIVVTLKPVQAIMPCMNLAYSLISFITSTTLLLKTLSIVCPAGMGTPENLLIINQKRADVSLFNRGSCRVFLLPYTIS